VRYAINARLTTGSAAGTCAYGHVQQTCTQRSNVASGLQNTNVRANLYETGQNRTMNCDIMAGCHSARQEVTTWVKKTKMMSHHNKMNLYIYIYVYKHFLWWPTNSVN